MQRRGSWRIAGPVALAMLVGACSGAATPAPTTAPVTGASTAPTVVPTIGPTSWTGRTLKVASWGGDWGAGAKASSGTLFEAQTGAKVEYSLGNPSDNITKLLAAPAGDPPFDVMQVDSLTELTMIQKGLIDKVDHTKLPLADLFTQAEFTKDYGPAFTLVPVVITWLPAKFKELGLPDPTSFDDLLNPALKGKIAYPGMAVGFSPLIIAGLANAWFGDKAKVGDAMDKLKTAAPRIYAATPELTTWLTNKEVYVAVTHTATVQAMKNQGFDLGMVYPKAGTFKSMVYWNTVEVIHGTKNADMASKWLQINLGCDAQRLFGLRNGVLPTCKAVSAEFATDPKLKTISVTVEEMAAMYQVDPDFINSNREAWNALWNQKMSN